jgi:hypothetical protein
MLILRGAADAEGWVQGPVDQKEDGSGATFPVKICVIPIFGFSMASISRFCPKHGTHELKHYSDLR